MVPKGAGELENDPWELERNRNFEILVPCVFRCHAERL